MAGRMADCVCGKSVLLPAPDQPPPLDIIEAEFEDADETMEEAPLLSVTSLAEPRKKLFRSSNGRNVEIGESEEAAQGPLQPKRKKRKRRHDKESATVRKRRGTETILAGLKRSFLFPLRTESLFTIGLLALAYGSFTSLMGFLPGGLMAGGLRMMAFMFLGTVTILGYFAHFLFQVFRLASVDEDDLPLAMDFDQDAILTDLSNWIAAAWWSFSGYAAFLFISDGLGDWGHNLIVRLVLLAACGTLLPMALIAGALYLQWLSSNPWTVLTAILRTPLEYGLYLMMFGTLCLVPVGIGFLMPRIPESIPILTHLVIWSLMFYALTASAYGFGNFYYRNRKKIGWFGELPPSI